MTKIIRLTRSQEMALIEILVSYARSGDVQEFVDISTDTATTVSELLTLIAENRDMTPDRDFTAYLRRLMPPNVMEEFEGRTIPNKIAFPPIRPIKTIADIFTSQMERHMPATPTELSITLWTFGEVTQGELERRLVYSQKLAQDALNLQTGLGILKIKD
jgi:hypothetical protein